MRATPSSRSPTRAALILGDQAEAEARLASAGTRVEGLARGVRKRSARRSGHSAAAESAVARSDEPALAAARATVWTTILRALAREARRATAEATSRGHAAGSSSGSSGRRRASRAPRRTRPSRSTSSRRARVRAEKAATSVRHDLLDTYDARLRTALVGLRDADAQGFGATRAEMGALALGYWRIVAPAYRAQRRGRARACGDRVVRAACGGFAERREVATAALRRRARARAFRAAPLAGEELVRRAGQLDRFLRLVPIEYGRGVQDGRVTLDFEIQEAVTFRDGAAAAFHDLEPSLAARNAASHRRLGLRSTSSARRSPCRPRGRSRRAGSRCGTTETR